MKLEITPEMQSLAREALDHEGDYLRALIMRIATDIVAQSKPAPPASINDQSARMNPPAERPAGEAKCAHGLYELTWKEGGTSLASVGSDVCGRRWFAPTNWITVPCFNWSLVQSWKLVGNEQTTLPDAVEAMVCKIHDLTAEIARLKVGT